jgi:hypothetical protein
MENSDFHQPMGREAPALFQPAATETGAWNYFRVTAQPGESDLSQWAWIFALCGLAGVRLGGM